MQTEDLYVCVQECHTCSYTNIHCHICQDSILSPRQLFFSAPSSLHLLPPILHNYPEGCAPSSTCSGPIVTPFSGQQWTGIGPVRSDYRQAWPGVNLLCPSLCQHAHTLPSFIAQTCYAQTPLQQTCGRESAHEAVNVCAMGNGNFGDS